MTAKSIEWTDVTPTAGGFCCEASDLGLAPGEWPHFLKTGLGNGRDFVRQYRDDHGYIYLQERGNLQLMIFND